jgi:hypothetical protein
MVDMKVGLLVETTVDWTASSSVVWMAYLMAVLSVA